MLNVRDFGAKGDGQADDTQAIQKALNEAAGTRASAFVSEGTYLCSTIKMPPNTGLLGNPTWDYRHSGGSILRLADEKATCLIDITGAFGATLAGLCLEGQKLGRNLHGVWLNKPDYGQQEDAFRIERCRISQFTGDGIRLDRVWCFSVRHCMVAHNSGNGLRLRGWDGFVLDNWLSGNTQAGYGAYEENASMTMTGNRIEWNAGGGIVIHGGNHYNVTGNYVDRSGGPGISLLPSASGQPSNRFAVTGNLIYRSARPDWRPLGENEDCHIRLECVEGAVVSGNSLSVGRDDGAKGHWSPGTGVILRGLKNSIVKDNVMHEGALRQLVLDLGGHSGETVIRDNVGSLAQMPTA